MAKDSDTKMVQALYDLIVTMADGPRIDEASGVMAKSFSISPESAGQVLKSAPIIFLSGIKRSEIRTIKAALCEVSKCGVEFKLTAKPSPAIPRVIWPTKPNIETLGHAAAIPALGFTFGAAAITCPSCGEVMVFRQIGKPLVHPAASPAPAATPGSAPALKPAAPPPKPAPRAAAPPPKAAPKPEPKPAKKPAKVEEPEEIAEEPLELVEEAPTETEEVEEVPSLDDDTLDVGEPLEEVEEAPEIEEESVKKPATKGGKPAPKPEPKAAAKPAAKPAAKTTPKVEEEETLEVAETPEEKPKPTPSRVAADGEPLFSVFLSKIGDPAKQAEAAKLIAEVRGIPLKEAKEKVKGMLIPVLKDVSKEEADACLEKFQKLKISGKVTKKK